MKNTVWIAGRVPPGKWPEWEIMGVFSAEKLAVKACSGPGDFIGPVPVDDFEWFIPDVKDWEGSYYPSEEAES